MKHMHLKGTMYEIYHSEHDDQWRYTLGTIGKRPLITIGLNPSTATQEKLDNTVTKVEKVDLPPSAVPVIRLGSWG